MSSPALDVLVLADLHYTAHARHACPIPQRQSTLARILVRKALGRLRQEGVTPGLIVLLGDLVDDGDAPGAGRDLTELAGELMRTGIPVLAVPGNHDGDPEALSRTFGCRPGLHEIGGYGFLVFHDRRVAGDIFARPDDALSWPARHAAANPERPLIALQHNPLHPAIVANYPYMLANGDAVLRAYRDANVLLSLSGHYHAGQSLHTVDGTQYQTVPALAESPYTFTHVRLQGRSVASRNVNLSLDVPGLVDVHNHTEFAYCATTITASHGIALAQTLGLAGVCIVEHTFQLYFPKDEAWSFRWQGEPERVARVWGEPARGRMAAYRAFAQGLRSPFVQLGLEAELYGDGRLLLAPQDADGWDLLLGAIHEIEGFNRSTTTQAEAEALFLRDVDRLLAHPIHVLAHPFRFFARKGLAKPEHLYRVVAERLAARGVAAEINFHTNEPELPFFRECLKQDVRLATGSDAHELAEAGDMTPHLRLLQALGLTPDDFPRVLFRPGA
jgi:histidinol phosphatase-like PHP family hydrolase